MSIPTLSISQRWLAVVLTLLVLLTSVLLPHAAQAQAACPLPVRLQVGDAVELIGNRPNRVRTGPGLSYAVKSLSIEPGVVWYVQQGPVCANGINWYQVAAYDVEGWTAEGEAGRGYYLTRTDLQPIEGCYSNRLAVGMRVQVGDGQRQHVRQSASKNAAHVAWLYPGTPVTIMDGPRCAGGWVWWYIRDDSGRMEGWASEGDGPARPWLVPAWGGGSGSAAPTPTPAASAMQPAFTGSVATSWTLTPDNHVVNFSPDQEAMTVFFSDFIVRAPVGGAQARRVESLAMPVRSGPRGYTAQVTLVGTATCMIGGRATITLQVGSATRTVSCLKTNSDQIVTLEAALPANADLRIVITVQAWSAGAQPSLVAFDLLDTLLTAR